MTIGLHMFRSQIGMFDPVALQDQNVCIRFQQQKFYRRVDFLEGLPPFQCIDLGALAAATVGARTNLVNLEMYDDEFGLFRWYPIDNAQIRLFIPRGVAKWELRNMQDMVDKNILTRDSNLVSTEIAVWEDNRPAVEAINGMDYALAAVRIIAMGYRFHTEECLPVKTDEFRVVSSIRNEMGDSAKKKTDGDLMRIALIHGRLPVTNVWASGFGASGT